MTTNPQPDELLDTALKALSADTGWRGVLDELLAPIYLTDADGAVTYWNRACVQLAGRQPELGHDKWCVTWKTYTTTGESLPHDQCPMADAIRQQRMIRDVVAIAERPDGSRIAFRPYPTPLFDDQGALTGAINMLIDVTDEQSKALNEQANCCRRVAAATYDRETSQLLSDMAAALGDVAKGLTSTS